MSFTKILLPTDGRVYTSAAIGKGIELAKISGGTITALYILDQSVYSNMPMDAAIVNVYQTLEKEGHDAMDYVRKKAEEAGVQFEEKIVEGVPAATINSLSADYDIVVMGTLGRTGVSKALMGSVAEKVIEGAKCPVMVVRPSKGERACA
ncbi:Universal stress protein UspA-related nucleotide-binding protein [Thermoplasmatales archaeon BRNA1]|nr:Universal stress protein UspA-related nucleotide-binding protein [Thermoplasmatales archaeon BRNA1]